MILAQRFRSIERSSKARAKSLLTRTEVGRRTLLPHYPYMFSPEQLWSLCQAAGSVARLGGAFAEVGVYEGCTTIFLNRYLEGLAEVGEPPKYYCIDTFRGFTSQDIQVERQRGKTKDYAERFFFNSRECFQRTMQRNDLANTIVIQADAAAFDYESLPPLSFALIDVDLLRPVRAALLGCWNQLLPGGMVVVDDCDPAVGHWDGAYEAFVEFCNTNHLAIDIRHRKLGFISRPDF